MMAPIIPGLNDSEILSIAKETADAGARNLSHTMVRLNGDVELLFGDWLERTYPDRKEKVMNFIRETHGGQAGDSRFGTRMSGEGTIAQIVSDQFRLARKLYFKDRVIPPYNLDMHGGFKSPQLKLFS